MEYKMKSKEKRKVRDLSKIPEQLMGIQLFSREQTSSLLGISISFLDLLPENKLVKTRIGRRCLYSWESINQYIKSSSGGNSNELNYQ